MEEALSAYVHSRASRRTADHRRGKRSAIVTQRIIDGKYAYRLARNNRPRAEHELTVRKTFVVQLRDSASRARRGRPSAVRCAD